MSDRISFQCPSCSKRLKAPTRYVGRSSSCPSCGKGVRVPPRAPEEAGPVFVMDSDSAPRVEGSWMR